MLIWIHVSERRIQRSEHGSISIFNMRATRIKMREVQVGGSITYCCYVTLSRSKSSQKQRPACASQRAFKQLDLDFKGDFRLPFWALLKLLDGLVQCRN